MNKVNLKVPIIILFIIAFIIVIFIYGFNKNKIELFFHESDDILTNPERGLYVQVDSSESDEFIELNDEGYRLTLLAFNIYDYSNKENLGEKIQELRTALQNARQNNISVIFRAAYGFDENCREPDDIKLMRNHIKQISEALNEFEDIIFCVQAGMLGDYGEWHSGKYLVNSEAESKKARLYILDSWERYLNNDIKVAVRRPRFVREAQENNILNNRLSYHNDALLSTDSDMGTYDDDNLTRTEELEWMDKNLSNQINGGEMPQISDKNTPINADKEFAMMHISYLNRKYNKEVFNHWDSLSYQNQNAQTYFINHLGYRLSISTVSCQKECNPFIAKHIGIPIKIELKNTGYAPISDNYNFYLVLSVDGKEYLTDISKNDAYSICNNQATTLKGRVKIDSSININENSVIKIGLKVSKNENEVVQEKCVELSNAKNTFEGCVNWFAEYSFFEKKLIIK